MLVLGIESTCDEMAAAVVKDGKEILSNVVASQTEIHRPFGGVFPELACRQHLETLIPVIKEAIEQAGVSKKDIELIAVAKGPGLVGALLIGLHAAKALSLAWGIPFVGVNHVEAHLYAAIMDQRAPLPALGAVLSGGHTFLMKIHELGDYELIGTTLDDAVGEAFDKVATLLGLPYPGGVEIEQLAQKGSSYHYPFKNGTVKGRPWDFSFSGLKTNVLYTLKKIENISEEEKAHIAASFQEVALGGIVDKALKAALAFSCKSLILGGGVTSNKRLRALLCEKNSAKLPLFFPPGGLSLDNAAMIAGLGFHTFQRQGPDALTLEPMIRFIHKNHPT